MTDYTYNLGPPFTGDYTNPFAGDSDMGADAAVLFTLESGMGGGSSIVADETRFLTISLNCLDESHLLGDISWWAAPGAPPKKPSLNSAFTLQQFIDSTGVSRSAPRIAPTHSMVVDPNPSRKTQAPR
jgi:hypothetical protein